MVAIEDPCVEPAPGAAPCRRRGLDRTVAKLQKGQGASGPVRLLMFGDSHIAADYITGYLRDGLQARFGDGGRGFTHPDQPWGYGGRRLQRGDDGWVKDRIVDAKREGLPFGFSGMSIESKKDGARVIYRVQPADREVRVYYQAQPGGATLTAFLDGQKLGELSTDAPKAESKVWSLPLPATRVAGAQAEDEGGEVELEDGVLDPDEDAPPKKGAKKAVKVARAPDGRTLRLVAGGAKARLYGVSFEGTGKGVVLESIGPVGADAKVYLDLGRASFEEHLRAHRVDGVLLMVGGNDALKIRKGWRDLAKVEQEHRELIALLRRVAPEADCLLWGPMDAGDKKGGKVVSRTFLAEVREMQRRVAAETGCAFWDTLEAMGGLDSIGKWHQAKVMNADLVHPRKPAADLLGRLFTEALLERAGRSE